MTRGQNSVHVLPSDWPAAERILATLIDRIDLARDETQLLVLTPDAENAAAAAAAVVRVAADRPLRVLAATASPRASRLLRASPAHVVTGAPADLVTLLQSSALKPESVRGLLFAWLDPIIETPDGKLLETLLGELPKEGARVVLVGEMTPALETLIERYARRARRAVEASPAADAVPLSAEYVATSDASRFVALRRLLDALDLPRAVLYARAESARAEVRDVARALGYSRDAVRLAGEGDTESADPLVLVDLPSSREELRALAGGAGAAPSRKIYALIQPSQVSSLRALLGGGAAAPVALLDAAERARGKDAALRASLREVLASGDVRREILALEPLLAEHDGIEIAAAALRLLEQQRPVRPAAQAQQQPMQRLFVNLGEKDGIRAQEIVAAIATEAGIPGSQIGKVEVRDTHSIVEVAASVAPLVAEKLTGSVVRGRRVQARLDAPRDDRPARRGASERSDRTDRTDRPKRSFDRGARGDRPFRSDRAGERSERPSRGDRPSRGERPSRSERPARGDRPEGGARPFGGARKVGAEGPGRGDRPPRPRRDTT
ncbi:MAG TPA: DbpA RNA binding domain-containing protein [Gemmatimonadaceae bacterium]